MPKIIINEAERQTFSSINATENTVLVPLFLRDTFKETYKTEKFTSRDEFVKKFIGQAYGSTTGSYVAGPVIDIFDDGVYDLEYSSASEEAIKVAIGTGIEKNQENKVVSHKDKSYLMICELLSAGLSVVVKPLFHKGFFKDDHELIVELNKLIRGNAQNSSTSNTTDPGFSGAYSEFYDKNLYNIKFITTGAYPNIYDIGKKAIYTNKDGIPTHWYLDLDASLKNSVSFDGCSEILAEIAENRGDAVAIVELDKNLPVSVETNSYEQGGSDEESSEDTGTSGRELLSVSGSEGESEEVTPTVISDEWVVDGYNTIEGSDPNGTIMLKEFECDLMTFLTNTLSDLSNSYNYAAAFYPWGLYSTTSAGITTMRQTTLPAGFGYLMSYGNSVKQNPDWLAASGVIRGVVPGLISTVYQVGEAAMHFLQNESSDRYGDSKTRMCINPIMQIGTYGTRVWGNRVCKPNLAEESYFEYLNVRMLLCDIKKQLYHSSLRITFEPNDDIAWINFKKLNNTLLDQMQSGRGIEWYRWSRIIADKKATLKAVLTIKPIEALEYFDITVNLTDAGEVEVEEALV